MTIVKRSKLQWYGHVSRSSGLAKTILQGTVKGGRRPGRQRKRWEDNIREWTGLEFAKSQSAVENREKWRKLVVKSSVVPRREKERERRERGEGEKERERERKRGERERGGGRERGGRERERERERVFCFFSIDSPCPAKQS